MFSIPFDSPSFLVHWLSLVLTTVVSIVVARWVYRQAADSTSRTMIGLLLLHATMATLLLIQMLVESLAVSTVLTSTWYGLILAAPVVWFTFAVYYTGRDYWLTTPVRVLLGLGAIVPFALSVTNPIHRLLSTGVVVRTEPFRHHQPILTDLNVPLFVSISLFTLAGFVLLFRLVLFSRRAARWQSVGLVTGMLAVNVPAFLSFTQYAPIPHFPYGIYGSGVFGVIVALSLFKTRMFAVAPLARDALFDSLDDVVIVVDADRRLVDYNDRALAVFPSLEGEIGRPLDDVCPDLIGSADRSHDLADVDVSVRAVDGDTLAGDHGLLSDDIDTVTDHADSPFVKTVQLTIDGETRSFNVVASEITRGGRCQGYALVISDLTRLFAYSKALEAKTERLDQFASVLSHDLRNPVSVAMGNLELETSEGDSEHLRKTRDALERIEATIDDLLTVARSGDGVVDISPALLSDVAADAWNTADTGDATLSMELDEGVHVRADRSRLRTLFENLFRNGAHHGGSHVTVGWVGEGDDPPLESGFFVADDGPGIPEDDRERVFEYGYSTAADGTGFGLAIVDSVARAHGWSLAVIESESGGARFEVTGTTTVGEQHETVIE